MHRPIGRVDFLWEDGTREFWRDSWMTPNGKYQNVDPVTGVLHFLANSYEVEARGSHYQVLGHGWCNTRQLQNPAISDYVPALCGPVSAEVSDGRIASMSADFPDGSPGLSLTMLDDPVGPEEPVGRDGACITTVGIPATTDDGSTSHYLSIVKRRFELRSASIGFAHVDPKVPTTVSTTELDLPPSVTFTGCAPTVYPPDGWVLERTNGPTAD